MHTHLAGIVLLVILIPSVSAVTLTVGSAGGLEPGSVASIPIILDSAPEGLSGCNISVSLSTMEVAEIVSVQYPDWVTLNDNSSVPADFIWIKVVDIGEAINPGAENITIALIGIRCDSAGTTEIHLTVSKMSDDTTGGKIIPSVVNGILTVTPGLDPFPGCTTPPTDPDDDGLYEDINGNGRRDFDDVVTYSVCMGWIRENTGVGIIPYDYNGNGRIDFDDVVLLYSEVIGG